MLVTELNLATLHMDNTKSGTTTTTASLAPPTLISIDQYQISPPIIIINFAKCVYMRWRNTLEWVFHVYEVTSGYSMCTR